MPSRSHSTRSRTHPVEPLSPRPRRTRRYVILAFLAIIAAGGFVFADWWVCIPDVAQSSYVGGQSCVKCHSEQAGEWQGSYHDLAMDRASPNTVLGDFDSTELTHLGLTSRMFRQDGRYMVHTEGDDGKMRDFEVKYVLGVAPLQQYMVEFDRPTEADSNEVSRLQVLPLSWDTQKKKWFFLQPPDVQERVLPGDDLHWTGVAQRWNNMCADCHTTNFQKNFDVATKTYHTTFSDMDVSCEACHGPGSLHVQLANATSLFWDRKRGYGLGKLKDKDPRVEIETCAPCHSLRRITKTGYQGGEPFYDYFVNELIEGHLYHADGQIMEEVYEYGSFTQSKMYQKGIRCTDCHNPHTTKVKYEGNRLCTSCHQHPAGKYDSFNHHRHDTGREGALCTSCHMPKTTYMAVDPRLDHSFRVPRPDLSVQLGTPNACTGCHLDKGKLAPERAVELREYSDWIRAARDGDQSVKDALAQANRWAADMTAQWYGPKADTNDHFAHALAGARKGDPDVESQLVKLAKDRGLSPMVRATCTYELGQYSSESVTRCLIQLLSDAEPLVRLHAISNLERLPDDQLVKQVAPYLNDPIRSVRAEAGRVMARLELRWLDGPQRIARERAIEEYKLGLLANRDRAVSNLGLGVLAEQMGEDSAAQKAYETAIAVEPGAAGSRANLAAILERTAQSHTDESAATKTEARVAQLRHEELELLARDSKLVPNNASIRYRYGLSLYLHGRLSDAERELAEAVHLAPNTSEFVLALALLYQKQEQFAKALEQAKRLVDLRPDDVSFQQLLREITSQQRDSN